MGETLIANLNSQFPLMQLLDFCGRLLLACVLGAVIGWERSKRFKEAGIRTHIIVSCGAALLMIVSKYGFADLTTTTGSSSTAPTARTRPGSRPRWSAASAFSEPASSSKTAGPSRA